MPAGDIKISSIKVGNMDLTGTGKVTLAGFNIYEDILNPYGPVAEIRVIDPSDALGQNRINGSFDQDVEIKFSGDDNIGGMGGSSSLKLKMYQNKNLDDQSIHNTGAGKHKQYDIRAVSPELLNAQGNYIQKSFKGKKTSDVVKHVLEKGFKSKRQMEMGETEGQRDLRFSNEHPLDVLKKLNNEHVSQKYESSCFALFQQASQGGEHKYVFKTYEELFEKGPVVKLQQTTNLNFDVNNQQQRQNSIIWFKPSDNFFTAPRALSKSQEHTFDLTTHKVVAVSNNNKQNKFKFADSQGVYDQAPSNAKGVRQDYVFDKANSQKKHNTASAKAKRADFLSHLAQNSAELEVYYNPKIVLGSMIEIEIPKKASKEEGQEAQFNGKCLVVAIRTKYRVSREPPNCTMILRVVKASYKEGGGGSG